MAAPQPIAPGPQTPRSRSKVGCVLGCLGTVALLMVAFFAWLGYAVYHAGTPEGQREIAESHKQDQAEIEAFVGRVKKIAAVLPQRGTADAACPAGTKARFVPVVDSLYLTAVVNDLDPKDRSDRLAKSKLLRDGLSFPESILDAVRGTGKDEDSGFGATWGLSSIKTLDDKPLVVVVRVDAFDLPRVAEGSFVAGSLAGSAVVVDWKGERALCHGVFEAKSSEQISYGGGVRLKVGGIPMPAVGGSDAQEALNKDLKENASSEIGKALARIGAG